MIQITTWPGKDTKQDYATCEWQGRVLEVRSRSATTALARMLVAAGCPDQPWEVFTRAGERSLHGPSLHDWARRVVEETDRRGLRIKRYEESPFAAAREVC